jgi:hypothetical protein
MKIISNKTPMSRVSGKIALNCGHCGLSFERYACWIKGHANSYCGRACAAAARLQPTPVVCVECGTTFHTQPAIVRERRIVTCSEPCWEKHIAKSLAAARRVQADERARRRAVA